MGTIGNFFNDVRNTVNSICSDVGLSTVFRRFNNVLYDSGFMARPIGIVAKNYDFIRNTLKQNIGNGLYSYDGYGTPISAIANPDLTSESIPWFKADHDKALYSNYLDYVNQIYFDGTMNNMNFMPQSLKMNFFNYNDLLLENNKVGVIRNYDIRSDGLAMNGFMNGGQTNPNSYTDTQLGIVNNFYLNATLKNSYYNYTQNYGKNLTTNVYQKFGLLGEKGLVLGEYTLTNNKVFPQGLLTNDIIEITPLNYGFGTYDNIRASLDLITASDERTQEFINKSLLGFDLFSEDDTVFSDDDITDYSNITGKKYYPKKWGNYISKIGETSWDISHISEQPIRYVLVNMGNNINMTSNVLDVYAESEGNRTNSPLEENMNSSWNSGVRYGSYTSMNVKDVKKDIVSYTNKCFTLGKFDTLIARFHSNEFSSKEEVKEQKSFLSSAISKYGMSHGRNLLKKDHESERFSDGNGYSNPYCRVWTYHHQYHKLSDLIRPLYANEKNISQTIIGNYQINRDRLEKYGVKDKNRLVKFTPNQDDQSIKNCMFSIENLAWKHERDELFGHEKGPFGGRIMFFPPYGLSFSESVNVNWNPTQFIGRGESIYTYTNTERSGSLSFKILIDHPSLLNAWREETSGTDGDVDDVDSVEQKILRFFAGCEVLEPQPKQEAPVKAKVVVPEEPKPQPIFVRHTETSAIYFYVFFPNNYSGLDDVNGSKVKPVDYLINGIGCQKNNQSDIGTSNTIKYTTKESGFVFGGYEMGRNNNLGISCGLNLTTPSVTILGNSTNVDISTYVTTNKNGKKNNWGYRVDKKYANEVLRNSKSYYDLSDYGLNGKNYQKLLEYHTDAKSLDSGSLFSFVDVVAALEPNAKNILSDVCVENNVNIITKLLEDYDVVSVEANGYASSHGHLKNNNELNEHRAETILNWLNKCNPNKFSKSKCKVKKTGIGNKLTHNDASSIDAKVWRCVKVVINLEKEELIEQQATVTNASNEDTIKLNYKYVDYEDNSDLTNVILESTQSAIQNNIKQAENDYYNATTSIDDSTTIQDTSYGKEYEFFKLLEKNEPFLHNKIVDKIKYFDPAYHSITPEGFNARLTFLHQCTRQGSTSSASDTTQNKTGSNLAFGAPPVCVLRIGDFYYTKIIIESLQIDYEDITWDLNDEGIGVMPMIANVNLSFKFLGGSDLSGPITRLQNAVSFNYYANTVVYEKRSELVEYDEKGEIISFKKNK